MSKKEELQRRYRVAAQVEYCSGWNTPDYWIIDTKYDKVVEDGGSWNPWEEYEYFLEKKLEEDNDEDCE